MQIKLYNSNVMTSLIFTIFLTISFSSCFFQIDSGSKKLLGDYEVSWVDVPSNRRIIHKSKHVMRPYLAAYGIGNNFIIAKQYPVVQGTFDCEVDTVNAKYFIIHYKQKEKDVILGPLDFGEFLAAKKCFEIEDLTFSHYYNPQKDNLLEYCDSE